MDLKKKLYAMSELSGTYFNIQRIKRRFKVKKRIPDSLFNEAMRQLLFHHSSWMSPSSVFECSIGVLSGRFLEDDVFDLEIEIVTGLRNIAGKYIDNVVSNWDDLWYNYFDYYTLVLDDEEQFTTNEWFDLDNIEELHLHSDTIMCLDVAGLHAWLLKDRAFKTCSLFTCLESSLFMELSKWPLELFKDMYFSKNITYVIDSDLYKIKGTISDNALEQLWVILRVMRYLGEDLNLDSVVGLFEKHGIPVKLEYLERLKPFVEEFHKLLKIYPHML